MKRINKLVFPLFFLITAINLVPTYSVSVEEKEYQVKKTDENVSTNEQTNEELSTDTKKNQESLSTKTSDSISQKKAETIKHESISTDSSKKTTTISSNQNNNNTNSPKADSNQTTEQNTKNQTTSEKLGTLGRLYIPEVNLSVAVYYANVWGDENYNAQTIVDRKDSAAFYELGRQYIIADHNYQGFKKLESVKIGTTAYIKLQNGSMVNIRVKDKFIGKNLSYDLVDSEGTSIQDMDKSLIMYTCYNNNKNILVTRWERT